MSRDEKSAVSIGVYSVAEASRLLRVSPRNIRRWLGGYNYSQDDAMRSVDPLWLPDLPKAENHLELSFRDLIELRFVNAFVHAGIGLKTIRNCLEHARECVNSERPFSTGKFRTDGQTIYLESLHLLDEPRVLDLRRSQYVFKRAVEQTFKDLDLADDAVTQWRPYRGKASIVLDPHRSFGQPIASIAGVPTAAIADAVQAEGSQARVARLFDLPTSAVRDAVQFQRQLEAA